MGQPFYGSGTQPRRSDTRIMLLSKQVAALGGAGVNAVSRADTVRKARLKIERIRSLNTNPA